MDGPTENEMLLVQQKYFLVMNNQIALFLQLRVVLKRTVVGCWWLTFRPAEQKSSWDCIQTLGTSSTLLKLCSHLSLKHWSVSTVPIIVSGRVQCRDIEPGHGHCSRILVWVLEKKVFSHQYLERIFLTRERRSGIKREDSLSRPLRWKIKKQLNSNQYFHGNLPCKIFLNKALSIEVRWGIIRLISSGILGPTNKVFSEVIPELARSRAIFDFQSRSRGLQDLERGYDNRAPDDYNHPTLPTLSAAFPTYQTRYVFDPDNTMCWNLSKRQKRWTKITFQQ